MANSQSAIMRPLTGVARAFAAMQSRLYTAPPITIEGVSTQNWPSALQPVQPVGPKGSQPLLWGFWEGINQNITPRPDAELSAGALRGLAMYPLARVCIENVKDSIASKDWDIQLKEEPGEPLTHRRKRQENDQIIPKLKEFFSFPDGDTPWKDWVRPLLEDLLVIDAGCVLLRRTLSGKIVQLRVPDGAEILRLIDDQGYTPQAPSPAYTQLWEGVPRILLTTDQLVYRPRNIVRRGTVSSQLYGCSPTEQLSPELTTGIERLRYVLAFYTEGAVPGIVQLIPPGVTPDAIAEGMQWMNSELAGNLAKRRQWRDVQSFSGSVTEGPKDVIHQLKEPILADAYDDLHIRKIAFGYGTSATRLLKMMNRASSQNNQEASEEEGTLPWLMWLKSTMDLIIQRKMGYPQYEMVWDTSVELDQVKQSEIDKAYSCGPVQIKTINETRNDRGLEPRPEPEANQLLVITPVGVMPLDGSIERSQQQHDAAIAPKPNPTADPAPEPEPPKKKVVKAASEIRIEPSRKSVAIALAQTKMYSRVAHFLFEAGKKASAVKVGKSRRLRKADEPDEDEIDRLVEAAAANIPWSELVEIVEPDLMAAAVEGSTLGVEQLAGAEMPRAEINALISEVNPVARDWAKNRAAEMVGMKWVDGELVENPNAKWRIDLTTRNMLQQDITQAFQANTPISDLSAIIQNSRGFSQKRANMIAKTEISNAQMHGNAEAWLKNGNVQEFKWQLSADHVFSDICDILEMNSPYPIDKVFELLAEKHPNCECALIATRIKGVKL